MTHSALLADLVDLNTALEADRGTDLQDRKRRDRDIGQALQHTRNRPAAQIHAWLEQLRLDGWRRNGQQAVQIYHVLGLILILTGLVAGWGLAQAVLRYTGDRPINIVNALGVLVLPQMLLLVFWLLAAIPRRIPLFSSLQSALRFLNPGRLTRHIARLFPGQGQRSLALLWSGEQAAVLAPASRWLFSFWSQLFSVSFNVGVLLAVFYLISFSDLAFVWSTTLKLESSTFQRLIETLAWPWHSLFPEAVPGTGLIEASRYYRLEEGSLGGSAVSAQLASRLGEWWPFLVAAIVCYGLLPRLLTLLVSWLRFRHHLAAALPRLPGAPELLARMNSPLVSTSAPEPEAAAPPPAAAVGGLDDSVGRRLPYAVIDWSGCSNDSDDIRRRLLGMGIDMQTLVRAGGSRSTDEDAATVASLCRQRPEGVAIIVRAWEPPLLEFLDFVQALRAQCDGRQPLVVLLRGETERVSERDQETWRLTLGQLGDPDLHVEVMGATS